MKLSLMLVATLLVNPILATALESGEDVFVPAAARAGSWRTDLYLFNPGGQATDARVYWLQRGQANPSPQNVLFSLAAGEVLVLREVVAEVFGLDDVGGALRVVSDEPLVVTTRIYNDRSGVTFGQGFEGVPRRLAVSTGGATDIVGPVANTSFRTNLVLLDVSGAGSAVVLSLRDTSGAELATGHYLLGPFEPILDPISVLDGITSVDDAVLHCEVASGSVIIAASKVDNDPATGDPTTLQPWRSGTVDDEDGTYQLAIYDSEGYATGGFLVVSGGEVTQINATYTNWDKGQFESECTNTFLWGSPEAGVHTLAEYVTGVTFERSYAEATITWTVAMTISNGRSLMGTVDAVGRGFPANLAGCNGRFPTLQMRGGRE